MNTCGCVRDTPPQEFMPRPPQKKFGNFFDSKITCEMLRLVLGKHSVNVVLPVTEVTASDSA